MIKQDENRIQKCSYKGCNSQSIYLEEHCWDHLPENLKKGYGLKLYNKISGEKNIKGENFYRVLLENIHFPKYVSFKECNFAESLILRSSFQYVDFRGSDLSSACLKECHFENSDFRGVSTSLKFADLRESHFDGALLQNTDLTGADLRDTVLVDVDMIGAKLQNAKLYSSRILNTRLRKESFCNFHFTKPKQIKVGDEQYVHLEPAPKGPCGHEGPDDVEGPKPLLARFVYTMLKNNFKAVGEHEDVKWAYYKEQTMERKRLFRLWRYGDREADALAIEHWLPVEKNSLFESRFKAFFKWIYECLRWFLAYGADFKTILMISLSIIFLFGFIFMFNGFEYSTAQGGNKVIDRDLSYSYQEFKTTLEDFSTSLYIEYSYLYHFGLRRHTSSGCHQDVRGY